GLKCIEQTIVAQYHLADDCRIGQDGQDQVMCLAQRRNGVEGGGALCHQHVDLIRIRIVDTKLTALLQEPPGNSPSHAPQPNDSNLHVFSSPKNHSSCACACVRWHPCALACSRLVDHPCDCGSRMRMPSMS